MTVKQRNKSDCAVAAVANATGNSYVKVRKTLGGSIRGGLHVHEIKWLLSEFGNWKKKVLRKRIFVKDWLGKKKHREGRYVLVLAASFLGDEAHAIAVIDGVVYGHYREYWPICVSFRCLD